MRATTGLLQTSAMHPLRLSFRTLEGLHRLVHNDACAQVASIRNSSHAGKPR